MYVWIGTGLFGLAVSVWPIRSGWDISVWLWNLAEILH